jgi:preprotein translocase subunit SecA
MTSRPISPFLTAAGDLATGRPYAERADLRLGLHDQAAELLLANVVRPLRRLVRDPARALHPIVGATLRHSAALHGKSDAALVANASAIRARLRRQGFTLPLAGECFALVREAAARTLGYRHYECQLMAGWGLLQGRLVEMDTGEGKTFAATLPACAVALAGYPVHVITVNDYLTQRDADEMGPLYRFLGLTVGAVTQGMQRSERREIYSRSIAYCTNKELAFDYLRDGVAISRNTSQLHLALDKLRGEAQRGEALVLRGLYFGIVDEADSVFIDEARTPLILSASVGSGEEKATCARALALAGELKRGSDYVVDMAERYVGLTPGGRDTITTLAADSDGVWTSVRAREELVTQALTALILFQRDQHYVVTEGKVQIVDESTGRVMPDRSWERGLHQLIEVKEDCELTEQRETLARLTYQRLFRRYVRLAGMTGTAKEVAREIRSVYGLDVVRVPLNRPSRRRYNPPRIWVSKAQKWNDVADTVARLTRDQGRPVLIGTRSVQASEEISAVLTERGIEHALLNAKQDRAEADIVAAAGEPARVTVATNMAGRGTDIRLGPDVAKRGGLHVILTEYHDSRRVDRQLFGRCARQGDPGGCEAIVSLEDEAFVVNAPLVTGLIRRLILSRGRAPAFLLGPLRRCAQVAAERRHAAQRIRNLNLDQRLQQMLAFSGRGE